MKDTGSMPSLALSRVGLVVVTAGLSLDLLGIGAPGFGRLQVLLTTVGGLIIAGDLLRRADHRAAAPAAFRAVGAYLPIVLQFALLVTVAIRFRIENQAFYEKILPIVMLGAIVHALVPKRFRLQMLVALSVIAIVTVFGVGDGLWLLAAGLGLIGLCHLPVAFGIRIGAVLAAGGVLAAARVGSIPTPWGQVIWPILASMFMFRLIVYLYDLRHTKEPTNVWRTISYFFLPPNLVFPLFPVIDFANFRRNHFDRPAVEIFQQGAVWFGLGIGQLLVYRTLYQFLALSPDEVNSPGALAQYVVVNFLLYFRVSGQFHTAVGLLHLFGFRLPATNRYFMLASSFTDFWRRINIYWKDFMMKQVYYPTYFAVRKLGDARALVIATTAVFLTTWLLHSYQWFWILGRALFSWTDVLFWTILGACMVGNTLLELRGRSRRKTGPTTGFVPALRRSAQTVAFFTFITVLWSFWTSPTVADWTTMVAAAGLDARAIGTGLLAAASLMLLLAAGQVAVEWAGRRASGASARLRWAGGMTATVVPAVVVLVIVHPSVLPRLNETSQQVVRDLRLAGLNRHDEALLRRGYYERLTNVNRFNGELWERYAARPAEWPMIWETEAGRNVGGFRPYRLVPLSGIYYHGTSFRTNRWGMRDQDYTREKPDDVYRVALLGASYVMGEGVGDNETFESILEARINATRPEGAPRLEILNFAVAALTPSQQLLVLREEVEAFAPDAVWLVSHPDDQRALNLDLASIVKRGVEIPIDFIQDRLNALDLDTTMAPPQIQQRIAAIGQELLDDVLRTFARESLARGIPPVLVLIPTPRAMPPDEILDARMDLAAAAGFTVVDLRHVYDGYDLNTVRVASWDYHPNAAGHRLIAGGLEERLKFTGPAGGAWEFTTVPRPMVRMGRADQP